MKRLPLLILLSLTSIPAARAQSPTADPFAYRNDPFYQQMDALALSDGAAKVLPALDQKFKQDPHSWGVVAGWLKDHTISFFALKKDINTFNSLYWAAYFDFMLPAINAEKQAGKTAEYQSVSQTALLALYGYEALVLTDAARCEDVSVTGPIGKTLGFRIKAIEPVYAFTPKDAVQKFGGVIANMEDHAGTRPPNREVCSSGAAKMADLMKQPGAQTKQVANPSAPNGKSTEIIPPAGYVYEPKYIDDAAWNTKRKEIRDKLLVEWQRRADTAPK